MRLAGRRRDPAVEQVVRDLPDRSSLLDIGCEDRTHDLGLGLEDLDPRRGRRRLRRPPVARMRSSRTGSRLPGSVELAAPVALGDLRALVLGDHALHLH